MSEITATIVNVYIKTLLFRSFQPEFLLITYTHPTAYALVSRSFHHSLHVPCTVTPIWCFLLTTWSSFLSPFFFAEKFNTLFKAQLRIQLLSHASFPWLYTTLIKLMASSAHIELFIFLYSSCYEGMLSDYVISLTVLFVSPANWTPSAMRLGLVPSFSTFRAETQEKLLNCQPLHVCIAIEGLE